MSSFLEIDFVMKINDKKSQRFDLCEVIVKGEYRLTIPCVLQYAGKRIGTCKRHNLHHTSYTANYAKCIVDSQGVACLLSL